jgi:hypothetical protein
MVVFDSLDLVASHELSLEEYQAGNLAGNDLASCLISYLENISSFGPPDDLVVQMEDVHP